MRLNRLLPDYYENNDTMDELQAIVSDVTDKLEAGMTETIDQCFPGSASVLLARWETILGIRTVPSLSDASRREQILAKLSGTGTTTKKMIESVAKNFANGEIEVTEENAKQQFRVRFVSQMGIPENMDGLKAAIEEIKPAHLAVVYEYRFSTWADIAGLTWGQAAAYTWNSIKAVKA